jgi:uncharacterized membrane protein YjjP (DUF1212 family)
LTSPVDRVEQGAPIAARSPEPPARAEQLALLSGCARLLFANGETTRRMIVGIERLGEALGVDVVVLPRWGAVTLRTEGRDGPSLESIAAEPLGVDMTKVSATNDLIDRVCDHRMSADAAGPALAAIGRLPPVSLVRFVLLTAAGAAALGAIFGASHWFTLALIALSAGASAALRRWLAGLSSNPFVPPFCAALLAGVVGAVVVRLQLSSVMRLVAVCPCMVLVPGAHFLNGAIDLARARIALGACRVSYAGLITLAISAGLLAGLSLAGIDLPVSPPAAAAVPLAYDVIAAGIAVAAYGTFFAMPWRMLPIPILIGMLAHALRWLAIAVAGASAEAGALIACLVVSIIVTPVADRLRMPFAAFAFASVVSLIPGVYLFRMAGGLLSLIHAGDSSSSGLLLGTIVDGVTALLIILAMAFGLIVPKMCIEYFFPSLTDAEPAAAGR